MTQPLILVDGSSYLFRAFHALPPLLSSKGQPTGAIYGVANMVKKLLKDYPTEEMAVVFDAKGKTFRDDLYPEYKAHRPPTPEDLSSQFEPLIAVLSALGLPILIIPHVEADDVIGTIASLAKNINKQVIISTGDKDMAQLVNNHITLINTMTNKSMDADGVKEKFGVEPRQIIDYLTLVGDTSDNIPGVRKCGPKTAVKWLLEYDSLDNLILNADKITGKIGEYLREDIPKLALSKKLVTIKTDVELPMSIADFKLNPINEDKLLNLAQELEFKSWVKELTNKNKTSTQDIKVQIVTQKEVLSALINTISHSDILCIDTETTSLNAINAELIGISLATPGNIPAYIPIAHTESSQQLDLDFIIASLKPVLENKNIKKVGQNLKYDYNVLKNYSITLQGIEYDTMLESYLLNSAGQRHDMDSLALKHLHYTTITYDDVTKAQGHNIPFKQVTIKEAAKYAGEDADITLKLHQVLYPKLAKSVKEVLHSIEMPLVPILAEIERKGVLIDENLLKKHGERLKISIDELQNKATQLVGHEFNLNSPKQLQAIFYDELKLPVLAKTPTGQASTSEQVLQELAMSYELPAIILKYRSLTKLLSTYIEALPKRINPTTKRVHTSYNQAVTTTGRLSSSDPNLQNIPVKDDEGRLIRKAFVAPQNYLILAADYSQIELRIMAHLSQDKTLLNSFMNGIDVHSATASEIFNIPLEKVTTTERRCAKAVNFGLIYGMSAFGLAKQLRIDKKEAQKYIDCYFQKYPSVLEYMHKTKLLAHEQGYVETIFGRRLYLPEINTKNIMRMRAAERTAINAPLQGSAADIIKKAMINVSAWINGLESPKINMIMQVHDELVFEVPTKDIDYAKKHIKNLMEGVEGLSVPLVASLGIGNNWDDAKSLFKVF